MNRREFFAANAALAVCGVPKEPCQCHNHWDGKTQTCRRCGTTLKQVILKLAAEISKEAAKPRELRDNPLFIYRNFVRYNRNH